MLSLARMARLADNVQRVASPIFYGISLATVALALTLGFLATLPGTSIEIPVVWRYRFLTVFPQAWAVFTKNPREQMSVRLTVDGRSRPTSSSSYSPIGGWARGERLHAVVLASLERSISEADWHSCAGDVGSCLAAIQPIRKKMDWAPADLCGEIYLGRGSPNPWAWYRSTGRIFTETGFRIAKVLLVCKDDRS